MFIGRDNELKELLKAYKSPYFEGIVLYGRRRIGKSLVIVESFKRIKDIPCIYFESIEASEKSNVHRLIQLFNNVFTTDIPSFDSFNELLPFLFSFSKDHGFILAIDEYPRLCKSVKGIDSIIANLINECSSISKLKLLLCGSEIDIMKSIFQKDNPLFGRMNLIIPVRQMNYLDSAKFYPTFSNEDKVKLYAVFGGVPYYNQYIDSKLTVKENIINLICSTSARLLPEVEMRLKVELGKLENSNEVLMALAKNKHKFSDILNESNVSSSPSLADSLKKLRSLEIISVVNPINHSLLSKKSNYYIGDPLIKFFYKYIFWNYASFEVMNEFDFYSSFVEKEFLEHDVPKCFEAITKQYLVIKNKNGEIKPPYLNIGTYYFDDPINKKNSEIDVACFNGHNYDFYEVKFTKEAIDMKVINKKISDLNACKLSYSKLSFVSLNGFKEDVNYSNGELISINDIYKD